MTTSTSNTQVLDSNLPMLKRVSMHSLLKAVAQIQPNEGCASTSTNLVTLIAKLQEMDEEHRILPSSVSPTRDAALDQKLVVRVNYQHSLTAAGKEMLFGLEREASAAKTRQAKEAVAA